MKLIIPVAGKGTRVRPLTHSVPKPLVPIAGKPMVQRIVDQVSATQGVTLTGIVFITGHLGRQFEEWARETYPDLELDFVEQTVQNGTADAVRMAEPYVGDEDVLVIFADTLFAADLEVMVEDDECDGVIWAAEVDDARRFGVVMHDEEKWMTGLVEKPEDPPTNLVNIGLYYLKNPQGMFSMIEALYEHEIKAHGEYNLPEALDLMAKNGKKLRVVPVEGWYDCGTNDFVLKTNEFYCRMEDESSVDPDALVEDSELHNCIVMEGARVLNCKLKNSIIGPRSVIKNFSGQIFVSADSYIEGN